MAVAVTRRPTPRHCGTGSKHASLRRNGLVPVGPEGGWSDTEQELIVSRGWQAVHLGSLILRSSTAAVRGSVELVQWRDGQD